MAASVTVGRFVRLGRRPTYADGLATNLEPDSVTLEIALSAADLSFCQVTEEEIAAGCVAVFNRESILAEGAAAAGVAAALRFAALDLPDGVVGVILTGGNVHHATFWQMLARTPGNPRLVALTDTLGRSVDDEALRRHRPEADHAMLAPAVQPGAGGTAEAALPAALVAALGDYTARTRSMLDDIAELARGEGLPLDELAFGVTREVNDLVGSCLASAGSGDLPAREQRVRALSQLAVAARLAFEWRSPGYDQSAALSVFDLGALGSPGVNYARYDQPGVADVERQVERLMRISPETHAVLMTSSGMAAFALASAVVFAAARVRTALTAPYLYFEAMETLQYWLRDGVHVADAYEPEEIVAEATLHGADVVFADPLANHPDQRMIDVERLAWLLADDDRQPWLVVDASMLPIVTAGPVTRAMPDRALYVESCSKYLQLGLDIAMAGVVVVPRGLEALARRMRLNLGLGIDRYGAELFPRYEPWQFERRLAEMERAACLVAARLDLDLSRDVCDVVFPGLASHTDHELVRRLGRTGSCVTLVPVGVELGKDQLDPVVDAAVREAAKRKLPLVKGVSFGFSVSRLSAASAMAETAPPFLRLAIGPMDGTSAALLADAVRCALIGTSSAWRR
jgi:cystathionine beta-lyase/cystathionine gamma-synthase